MTPEDRERWRWTFAGQAMTHMHWPEAIPYKLMAERSIHIADALIAELEKRGQEECDHEWGQIKDGSYRCYHCFEYKDAPSQEPCEHEWSGTLKTDPPTVCTKCGESKIKEEKCE